MSLDGSAKEHEPSAYAEREHGFEKIWIYVIILVAVGIMAGLLWLANAAG
jgi:hypothetical protein